MSNIREEAPSLSSRAWVKQLSVALSPVTRLFALVALAIYLPILLVVAVLVLASSPGPAFTRKAYRRSQGEQEIVYLYEFRTECWRTWQETSVGALLRTADLHRLPRLANVLLGEIAAGECLQRVGA